MLFSSIPFLCYFLVAVIAVYFAVPDRAKNPVLLAGSVLFYFYGEPRYGVVMLLSAGAGYMFGLLIHSVRDSKRKKLALCASIVFCLLPLLLFKYSDFLLANINAVFRSSLPLPELVLPIGISFYTFQILSYTIDVYRGEVRVQKNPLHFLTYVALFPQLIAGPIIRYRTVQDALESRNHSLADVSAGMTRFTVGLGKKVLLANPLSVLSAALTADDRTVLSYWLCAAAYTLQIYFDFSGYSDMAIGLGRIFGFRIPENFAYPYAARSITAFWRRWHISLGSWFREYVYIPLGGNRCSKGRWVCNILLVWFLTGFWHGAAWNFILWGLYFALLLLVEKRWLGVWLEKLPHLLQSAYVMLLVTVGFVLFNADSMGQAAGNLLGMFSLNRLPFSDSTTTYYLSANAVLLLVALVGATPLPARAVQTLKRTAAGEKTMAVLEPLFVAAVLLAVMGYLVDGSFNPFLYFRF